MMQDATVKFSDNGTKVLIISGTHGNESNAVKISSLLYRMLAAAGQEPIEGIASIEFLIGINDAGLKYNTREYASEAAIADINRSFYEHCPSYTQILKAVEDAVSRNDIVIDLHNSPKCLNAFCVDYAPDAAFFIELLSRNGLPFTVRESNSNTIKKYVNNLGKIGFTLELDNMGYSSDRNQIPAAIGFLKKVLESVKTIHIPKAFDSDAISVWTGGSYGSSKEISFVDLHRYLAYEIMSHSNGLIEYAKADPLVTYKKGETIASIVDYNGNVLEELRAPDNGFMTCVSESWYISENDAIGEFQPQL